MKLKEYQDLINEKIEHQKYEDALKLARQALKKYSTDYDLCILTSNANARLGNFDESIKILNKTIELYGNKSKPWAARGWIYWCKEDYINADKDFNKATELEKDNFDYQKLYGIIKYNLGQFKEALEKYNKALELGYKLDNSICSNMADSYFKLQNYNKAAELYKKALKYKFNDINSLCSLAKCYKKLNDKNNLEKTLNKIIKIEPTEMFDDYEKGYFLYNIEKYNEAIIYFKKSIDKKMEIDSSNSAMSLCCYKLQEYQKAYDYNEKAIETVRDELKNKT